MTYFYLGELCRDLVANQLQKRKVIRTQPLNESWERFKRRETIVTELLKIINDVNRVAKRGFNGNAILYRWLLSQKLFDEDGDWDPVIPKSNKTNPGFISYLRSKGITEEAALSVEKKIQKYVANTMQKTISNADPVVRVQHNNDGIVIVASNPDQERHRVSFNLTSKRYEKLKKVFEANDENGDSFHLALAKLCMRYNTMITICSGYNGGCPLRLLKYLRKELGVEFELFASPLNATLDNYFSAYDDTDIPFGSHGNFFDKFETITAKGGSFEINPPFTEEYLSIASYFVLKELDFFKDSSIPLTFFYIHPTWSDLYSFIDMTKSDFLVKRMDFPKNKHYYESGRQHEPSQRDSRLSGCDTTLIILQNSAARKAIPITDAVIATIRINFEEK